MKKSNLKRSQFSWRASKLLLLTLFAVLVGASPAWADETITESFEYAVDGTTPLSINEGNMGLSNGWSVVGTKGIGTTWAYYLKLQTSGSRSGNCLYANGSNSDWIVCPVPVTGSLSFYWKRNDGGGYVQIGTAAKNGNSYTISNDNVKKVTKTTATNMTSYFQETVDFGSETVYVAFLLNYAYLDDVTYTPYEETGAINKPTTFAASNITYNSAQLSWTAGGTEAAWQLVYSTVTDFDKDAATPIDVTDNPYTLTGLSPETTYYAYLRAKSGDDVSSWTAKITFTTTEQYAKPSGLSVAKQGTNAVLSWTAGSTESAWDVVYSTNSAANPNELSATTVDATSHTLTGLTIGNTYYVWVRANHGSEGSSWINTSFTLAYSTPAPTSVDGNGISNVTFGSGTKIVNHDTSKTPYYQDNSTQEGSVTPGSETTVAITFSTGYTYGTVIWVDWNQNYEFEDSEIVFAGESGTANPTTLNATFTVPAEQAAGNYRMRICAADNYYDSHKTMATAAGANSTPTSSYCVAQDYTLKVEELGDGAQFAINKNKHNFGLVQLNESAEQKFTITNNGNAILTVSFASDNAEFSVPNYILFTDVLGWGTVKMHYWGGETSTEWPGVTMESIGLNEHNQPQFRAVIPEDATGVIFNNGNGTQTVNLQYANSTEGFYTINELEDGKYKAGSWGNGPGWNVAAGESRQFAVKMNTETAGVKSGNITLSYTAANGSETVIPVSGTVIPTGAEVVDFNTAIPERWQNQDNAWTIDNGAAKCTANKTLTTQKLDFSGETAPFIIMKVKSTSNSSSGDQFDVEGSTDFGTTWTAFQKITKSYNNGDFGTSDAGYTTIIFSIPNTVNKLRFTGKYVLIDEIIGLKYLEDDPYMGVYTDAECTLANKVAATSVTKEFGFVTENPAAAVYYIKNDGTGTMTLSKGADPTGFTATLDKTSVAAGEHATLTIAMPVENNGGYHGGDVVVTAEGVGTFTVAAQGIVVEEGKLNLDFTTSDEIPTAWKANDWSKNSNGYYRGAFSSTTMETSTLAASAGEELVIVAKQEYNSGEFSVNYKALGADNWSTLIASTSLGKDGWVTLHAPITEAGNYLLQIVGNYYTQIQRIYGLSKPDAPEMVVYDGETVAAATYNFGKVTDENDATWTLTVKNEGLAKLTGLAAALSGDNADHYTATITGATGDNNDEIEANAQATVTVTQLKDNLGAHSATLTISATDLESEVITLSGTTVDHTALNVDFDSSNEWPAGWKHDGAWDISYSSNSGYARQSSSSVASSIIMAPLTVAATTDKLKFKAARYQSSNNHTLTVRYTTNGGITWTDYDWSNYEGIWEEGETIKDKITSNSTFNEFEITGIPTGTVVFDFYGKYLKLDDFTGDMKVASAPLVNFTTVSDNINGQNLQADGIATYTLANNGNAPYVGTVVLTNVTAAVEGEDVTYAENTLTIPAGKTATITVTMAFAAPYGEKTGSMTITSESWVGDINVNYTAELVDPTKFVEDFAGNAKPTGWYSETAVSTITGWVFSNGDARIGAGVAKIIITEKIGAEEGKNILSFDAKTYSGESQTLNVYTSTDRKTWSEAQAFALTDAFQTFNLDALADGEYYVKFEASNAVIDNIKGVKKLDAPAHDLYEVSHTMAATGIPGTEYTATVVGVSLRATEDDIIAELWLRKDENYTKVAELTGQEMVVNTNKTFTLTGNLPNAEGEYKMWATVKKASDGSVYFNTDEIDFTLTHTHTMAINTFPNAAAVQADDNNQYTGTFFVTVQNTGSAAIAANDVSVSLIDNADAEHNFTATWTAENSNVLYMNTKKDATDIATDCTLKAWCWNTAEDGEWITFTNVNEGFWSLDLNGKTNFKICRFNPAGTDENPWNNVWNQSADLTLASGNLVKFNGYDNDALTFTSESMAYLEPNMTTTLKVTVTGTLTDGENANVAFKAKENFTMTYYGNGLTSNLNVTAAPTIVLDEADGTIASTGQNRKVQLAHTFVAGWNTICVPFALNVTDIHANAKAMEFIDYNSSKQELTFSPVTELEANKPYVIWVENDISTPFNFTGKTVTSSEELGTTFDGVTFQGTYALKEAGSLENMWGLTAAGKIAKASDTTTMKGFRAYFNGLTAEARVIFFDEGTTGIRTANSEQLLMNSSVYNMNGQKVEKVKKGLYIINGKKQVIK